MTNLKVITLNCRGAIKNTDLQNRLLSCFEINTTNIVLLQETHVSNFNLKNYIEKKFDCITYWSFGSNDSRGVAILILNNFTYHIEKFQRDNEGRIISVDIQSDVGSLRLISVYCPNDIPERKLESEDWKLKVGH